MATKKDLVEAHSFSRRRLVTAFLSGAPGGREVEPTRPGRTVVGGVALAVLLIAGAAIASVLAGRTQEDWNQKGLVVSREEAAPYVILKDDEEHPTLIPVINITSAQLILGANLKPTYVDQEVIEDQTPGEPIGIFGAPQTLPRPSRFIQSGWSSCTAGDQVMTRLASVPEVTPRETGGLLVASEGNYYLLARSAGSDARAHSYQLPGNVPDTMLDGLGLDNTRAQAPRVPGDWLRLFPPGGSLGWDTFGIEGVGEPAPDPGDDLPDNARIGEYWQDPDGSGIVITQFGSVLLSPFALTVYANTVVPKSGGAHPQLRTDATPSTGLGTRVYDEAEWPESSALEQIDTEPCALLVTHSDGVPVVELADDPATTASAAELTGSDVSVERGRGAFVRSGDFDDVTSSSAWVIDPRGEAFPLVGVDTIKKLGYADADEPLVPDSWIKLFPEGTELSTSLALCPPAREPGETCQEIEE